MGAHKSQVKDDIILDYWLKEIDIARGTRPYDDEGFLRKKYPVSDNSGMGFSPQSIPDTDYYLLGVSNEDDGYKSVTYINVPVIVKKVADIRSIRDRRSKNRDDASCELPVIDTLFA